MRYLTGTQEMGLWHPKGANHDLVGYTNSDFIGCRLNRKITSDTYHLLENSLVSCYNKKQSSVTLSTTEVEYIIVGTLCSHIIWMKRQLSNYNVNLGVVPIRCDTTSTINLIKNPILHFQSKNIKVGHNFIRGHIEKWDCILEFLSHLINS